MSPAGPSPSFHGRRLAYPFLLQCDRNGRVLWMSEQTRAALGPAANLLGTIPRWGPPGTAARAGTGGEMCYSRLLEFAGTVLIGVRPPATEGSSEASGLDLLRLQGSFSLHYFRLQKAEGTLSSRVHRRRQVGLRALRQIQLERQRLGRELHTSVGQPLSAIRMQAETIASQLPTASPAVQEALERISALTAEALEQVRSVSKRLHPPEWQRLTLESALQQLWSLSGIPQRFQSSLRIDALSREPELDVKTLLYRAAQEAASNLMRHSRATSVELVLAERSEQIVLSVQDNGVGFDAASLRTSAASISAGIGLRSIREEVEDIGGRFIVESGPSGTKLEVSVPFTPAES